jgi:SAM-dependent methyltransferase
MTVTILATRAEIDQAREELRRRNLSCLRSKLYRTLQRFRVLPGIRVGDHVKSWDVLTTADFIHQRLPKDAPILDLGAYASEILGVLHRLGFTALAGADLNAKLRRMPNADLIRYEVTDYMHTPFPDGAFAAITAISAIEHGFQSQALLSEVARLLRPGGYFVASFDYWPTKIDTRGQPLFGLDWRIFSRDEVLDFLREARTFGLEPDGPVQLDASSPVMHYAGKDYTFAWLALRKQDS